MAERLRVRKNTIYAWVTRREIPFVKLPGNTTRFPKRAVEVWLQKRLASGKSLEKGIYLE
jgi:excisionase family DNA binding protein